MDSPRPGDRRRAGDGDEVYAYGAWRPCLVFSNKRKREREAARSRERRAKTPGATSGKSRSFLDAPEFIAWDGEGITIERPSGMPSRAVWEAAIAERAAQLAQEWELEAAPYVEALAELGGKLVPAIHYDPRSRRWVRDGEFDDVRPGWMKRNDARPMNGRHAGNLDLVTQLVADRLGPDVTDNDVLDFFSRRSPSAARWKALAREELEAALPKPGRHIYTMLCNSRGDVLEDPAGLSSEACLSFLVQGAARYPNAKHVIFAGGYDVNMMLSRDMKIRVFERTLTGAQALGRVWTADEKGELFTVGRSQFWLGYRPRKLFTVAQKLPGERYVEGRRNAGPGMRLWDVWGYFQSSFVKALRKWFSAQELARIVPELEEIEAMKALRGSFADADRARMLLYCQAECRALEALMLRVAESIAECGLRPTRWDGVGAIGSALLKKYGVKDAIAEPPPEVQRAASHAYAGGRIEQISLGYHEQIHEADLRSAYPSFEAQLPDLRNEWRRGYDPAGFGIARVAFDFDRACAWYPLFYRTRWQTILFPATGEGWYYTPEVEAAIAFARAMGGSVDVRESWELVDDGRRPFAFVPELYQLRDEWKRQGRAAENILRLGLNSIYGKTAQRASGDRLPPFFAPCWAGYITSATRAELVRIGLHAPEAIAGFATDGIFSREPLPTVAGGLGTWAPKTSGEYVSAQAGVSWLRAGSTWTARYRGFDFSETIATPDPVLGAWKRGQFAIELSSTRFWGMGLALASVEGWERWQTWQETPRLLDLTGKSPKRVGASGRSRPDRSAVILRPTWNWPHEQTGELSAPYVPIQRRLELDEV